MADLRLGLPRTTRPAVSPAERLARDIDRIRTRVREDRDLTLVYWSQYRSREILLEALDHPWSDLTLDALLTLAPDTLTGVQAFFDEVRGLRSWALHTEAMPTTLGERIDVAARRLDALAEAVLPALGGVPAGGDGIPAVPEGWGTFER